MNMILHAPDPAAELDRSMYGALDLGTNNCRLLIAKSAPSGFDVVDAFSRIVRLGEGIASSYPITDRAMARAIAALKVCAAKLEQRGVAHLRCVVTEACRRACNCDEFAYRVWCETGLALEVIAPHEESRLALLGCSPLLEKDKEYALFFDIGGGSTELSWCDISPGEPAHMLEHISLPIGVVSYSESGMDYRQMVQGAVQGLQEFKTRAPISEEIAKDNVQMLGASGTVTTLSAINQNLPEYSRSSVDGSYLTAADVREVTNRILSWEGPESEPLAPCVGPDRADLLVAGCAILEGICEVFNVPRLRIADRGLRDGILLDLMAQIRGQNS